MSKKWMPLIVVLGLALSPAPAFAQSCESASTADQNITQLMKDITEMLNNFYKQEVHFTDNKVATAQKEVDDRLGSLDKEVTKGISAWWRDYFLPSLKEMTKQVHIARIDQTMRIGMMMDAQMVNETLAVIQKNQALGKSNIAMSEATCQADTMMSSMSRSQGIANGLATAWGVELQTPTLNTVMDEKKFEEQRNLIGTAYAASSEPDIAGAAALGNAAARREMWKEYVKYFCDPARGDQGCKDAGSIPGGNREIVDLLWGEKQSIALDDKDTRRKVAASQRYLLSPRVFNPIKFPLVNSVTKNATPEAKEEMFRRRAWAARLSAVNNTVSRMLADRVVTSDKTLVEKLLNAAGLSTSSTEGSSYREVQEVMTRGRLQDPEFIAKMVADPKQILQEQGTINGMGLQQLYNIGKRQEEMMFMEASMFASDLDKQIPRSSAKLAPVR